MDAKDFFTFAYTTVLETNEILCEAIFPIPNERSSGSYLKLERVAGDFAIVSIALQMQVNDHHVCESIGIGLGGVGVVPIKPFSVENLLLGKVLSSNLIEEAEQLICENIDPPSDSRGSAEYKREVLKVLFRRALMKAIRGTDSSEMAYRF